MPGTVPYYGANGVVGHVSEAIFDEPLVLVPEDQHGGFFSLWQTKQMAYAIDGPAWVNNHAHVLRATSVPHDWLLYSLIHRDLREWVNESTRSKINRRSLERIPIGLPPDLSTRLSKLHGHFLTRSAARTALAEAQRLRWRLREDLLARASTGAAI